MSDPNNQSAVERLLAAQPSPPQWLVTLARACDAPGASQAKVAKQLGYAPAVISTVLKGTYKGSLTRVETAVRAAFDVSTVTCPVMGDIASRECLEYQRRDFDGSNHLSVKLYRACRSCHRAECREVAA